MNYKYKIEFRKDLYDDTILCNSENELRIFLKDVMEDIEKFGISACVEESDKQYLLDNLELISIVEWINEFNRLYSDGGLIYLWENNNLITP